MSRLTVATASYAAASESARKTATQERDLQGCLGPKARWMRVGERRSLVVPPSLDGRTYDPAFIPVGSTLYYDIELVTIVK